jgi:glutamate-1-semialdehyde 2,1-aminomutase
MERVAPVGDVYQAGTLAGNPLAVAAALATLELLDKAAYRRLDALTRQLAEGLQAAADAAAVEVHVQSVTGLVTPFFSPRPVRSFADARGCDLERYGAWCRGLLARGVYPPPSQFEAWFPSIVHRHRDVERTLEAARAAFEELV